VPTVRQPRRRSQSKLGRSARRWHRWGESADWAALDPDFAAGKRAIVAGDWKGAINALTSAGLRDDRNADIQNYLGYAHRRLRELDPAMLHYQRALTLNPRHRSAHEHLGEAYWCEAISPKQKSISPPWSESASSPVRNTMI
jgi:Flp pilus assembly protein TadD